MAEIKKMTAEQVALAFADEYREILSWRIRRSGRDEPHCWFVHGRLDEYGISARDLGRIFLKNGAYREPRRFGIDVTDERVYDILERAKKLLTV